MWRGRAGRWTAQDKKWGAYDRPNPRSEAFVDKVKVLVTHRSVTREDMATIRAVGQRVDAVYAPYPDGTGPELARPTERREGAQNRSSESTDFAGEIGEAAQVQDVRGSSADGDLGLGVAQRQHAVLELGVGVCLAADAVSACPPGPPKRNTDRGGSIHQ